MAKKKLIIFPFNGNGIEALDCIDFDRYELIGFIDDDPDKRSDDYEIFSRRILEQYRETFVLAVPGSADSFKQRQEIISSLRVTRFINAIHPRAFLGKNVKVGYNCLVMAGVVITSNACVGNHVCILPNTVIHHDAVIKDYTLIGSNVVIAGGTRIGRNCYIGSGTNVINGISIGDASLIGLGSNVINSVCSHSRIAGNPAKELNSCHVL
jgi:sugar O-acyltransferase (sialic acid O-acetyltransferase NeuD family)